MINYFIEGTQEIQYKQLLHNEHIKNIVSKNMHQFGFKQVETPPFEDYDMYVSDNSISRKDMLKSIDKDGRVLVLRPDATIPITKMAANSFPNEDILKFSYLCTIYRENASKTNYRKYFSQAGVEYFGNGQPDCEAELIYLASTVLENLGLKNITIDIGHIEYLDGLLEAHTKNPHRLHRIKSLISEKNLSELKDLLYEEDSDSSLAAKILEMPRLFGDFHKTMKKARELCINDKMYQALDHLEEIHRLLTFFSIKDNIRLDLGLTNNLNYYTGPIFNVYNDQSWDNIISGGRYDKLSSRFNLDRKACGFGMNLSLVSELLYDIQHQDRMDVLLIYDRIEKSAVDLAALLRKKNLSVDCLLDASPTCYENYHHVLKFVDQGLSLYENGVFVSTDATTFIKSLGVK